MFKRYAKSPFEKKEVAKKALFEQEKATSNQHPSHGAPFHHEHNHPSFQGANGVDERGSTELPPRVFDTSSNHQVPPPSIPIEEELFVDPSWEEKAKMTEKMRHHTTLVAEEPDTTLGEGVVIKGELNFKKLLRIDGHFEGELVSEGKLIVGPTGVVKSNIVLKEAIIEGYIEGNLTVRERVELRGDAQVYGDIIAKSISVDEGVTIVGLVQINPREESKKEVAPQLDASTDKLSETE